MKNIKKALIILIISIVANWCIVYAYISPKSVQVSLELDKNESKYTNYYNKNVVGVQSYNNWDTFTILTNPCNNCDIVVTLQGEGGGLSATRTINRGETKDFLNTATYNTGNYRLEIHRAGFTTLTTNHYGTWNINQ